MGTILQKLEKVLVTKEAIRKAIVDKGQDLPEDAVFSIYPEKIAAIQTGTDTSDATASAGDILSGKTAYVQGGKVTGSIPGRSAADLTASGAEVTVPAGYYPSQVSKSVATATQATPSISVSSAGLITASATQSAGYVPSGTKSATKQLTTQSGKTVTPGTNRQTAVSSGLYTTGAVYVAGDANLKAENIRQGVSIFGVGGTLLSECVMTDISNFMSPQYWTTSTQISYTGIEKYSKFMLICYSPISAASVGDEAFVALFWDRSTMSTAGGVAILHVNNQFGDHSEMAQRNFTISLTTNRLTISSQNGKTGFVAPTVAQYKLFCA